MIPILSTALKAFWRGQLSNVPSIRPGRGNGVLEIPFSWFGFTLVGLEVNNDLEFVDDFSFSHKVVRESWMLA